MAHLVLVTSNSASRRTFFRAGGIRFIADIIPYLSEHYDVDFYVAGAEEDEFEYRGARVHIVKSRKIPFVDKRFLPPLNVSADVVLFLDYTAALSRNGGERNLVVMHHLAQSFRDENPDLYRKYFGRIGQRYVRIERFILQRVRKKAPIALAVSDVCVPYLREIGFDVQVVGNGINVDRYRPRKKEDYAVVIGRLVNYKRLEWAIEVSKRTGIPLKIIGTGQMESYLRKIAPKNVEFLGYVEEDEKIRILSRAKYLFAFSAFEGFDIPVIEAMACKAVPIASRNRAHEFIFSGRNVGVLVDSVEEAVDTIRVMEDDIGWYSQLAENGRRLVEEKWNAEVVAKRYVNAIESVLRVG